LARTTSKTTDQSPPRKKGGVKAAFQDLLDKLIAYWEVMAIYIEKNVHIFIRNIVLSSVWIFSALFFIFIAFVYLSYAVYLSLQKYLMDGNPILSSLVTAGVFLLFAVGLVEVVLKSKK
jgi:cation transport ATPase